MDQNEGRAIRQSTPPFAFFFLVLPYGISSGFVSITLPFFLTKAGFSVAAAGAIVAVGVSANLWLFLWGPLADLTLTPKRWYLVGLTTGAGAIFVLSLIPFQQSAAALLTIVVFVSQVATTLVVLPLGGLMAHTVPDERKGRAAGWYQAGNLGGNGVGGGAGVWLGAHVSKELAGSALAVAMLLAAFALYFASDVRIVSAGESFRSRMRLLGRDLLAMLKMAIPLLTIVLVASPIGAGAMNNLWSAVADDWRASADVVALVTGVLNGVVAALGCVLAGWIVDRFGRWWAYFGFGIALAFVAIVMALIARTPLVYEVGVLIYSFFVGAGYAAFSAMVVHAIGKGVASTKYAFCQSLGNLPVVYMTALNGYVHDKYGPSWMLMGEALAAIVCVILGLIVLRKIQFGGTTAVSSHN
ncbi:MAG TPA: MFS transporter [Chthoniobacterales bacterium]|nr:MFS transporter [Chthoniobacterales bacterium]